MQEWPQNMTGNKKYKIIGVLMISMILEVNVPVKFFGTGGFPLLIREGKDMLNVDDLRHATKRDWRKTKDGSID